MRPAVLLLAAWAVLANADVVTVTVTASLPFTTTTRLDYTFQTFTNNAVETATTSYALERVVSTCPCACPEMAWATRSGNPTSYSANPSDLAYPTFSSISGPLASAAPAPGLPNATALAEEALALVFDLKESSPKNCQTCKDALTGVAARMKVQQETLSDIADAFCAGLSSVVPVPVCVGLLKVGSTDIGGVFPAMDMQGVEGQTLCAFMFGTCDLAAPPSLDLDTLFKGTQKPAPRALAPCTKEPLKVLHISDYHLDLRYVVGAEAKCTGPSPTCCRVYPYTNVSAPIQDPASLFGNYACDTPEALGTSVFRAVPDVTGYRWCDFSFGIFTGDLVSHDLWELTPEYVLAEELTSYQNFFDGMGGVPVYPTLGYVSLPLCLAPCRGCGTYRLLVTTTPFRTHLPHSQV
jgi:hypothetical protein